jgi:hypothetical protein
MRRIKPHICPRLGLRRAGSRLPRLCSEPGTLTARLEIKKPSVNQPLARLHACFSPSRCAHIQYVYIYHTVTLPCAALGKRWLVGRSQSVPGRLMGRIGNHLSPLPLARSTARDGWDGLNRTSGPVVPPASIGLPEGGWSVLPFSRWMLHVAVALCSLWSVVLWSHPRCVLRFEIWHLPFPPHSQPRLTSDGSRLQPQVTSVYLGSPFPKTEAI